MLPAAAPSIAQGCRRTVASAGAGGAGSGSHSLSTRGGVTAVAVGAVTNSATATLSTARSPVMTGDASGVPRAAPSAIHSRRH